MKETGLICCGESVRGILDGRKTQTRRIVKPQPGNVDGCYHRPDGLYIWTHLPVGIGCGVGLPFECPYGVVGDRLWVKETFAQCGTVMAERIAYIAYKADNPLLGATSRMKACDVPKNKPFLKTIRKYRPSIYMPKWAARLWLEITGIRVERVQEITHKDALSEGCFDFVVEPDSKYYNDHEFTVGEYGLKPCGNGEVYRQTALIAFRELWDSLNAKRGYGWDKNPWVWVIEFKQVQEKPGKIEFEDVLIFAKARPDGTV